MNEADILRQNFATYLVDAYLDNPVDIAKICDEQIDQTGKLLSYVRKEAERKGMNDRLQQLEQLAQTTRNTLTVIEDWLGHASTRQAAMDSIRHLANKLREAGYEYNYKGSLGWRGSLLNELNDAGFFKGADDLMHYDPDADKVRPYRIYGNAEGPTLKQLVEFYEENK